MLGRTMALQVVSVWNRAFLCSRSLLSDPPGMVSLNDWRVPPEYAAEGCVAVVPPRTARLKGALMLVGTMEEVDAFLHTTPWGMEQTIGFYNWVLGRRDRLVGVADVGPDESQQ